MQTFQSIELISDALIQRGYMYTKVHIAGRAHRRFEKGPKVWTSPYRYVRYPFVSPDVQTLALHKNLAYDYVQALGYSIPRTHMVRAGHTVRREAVAELRYPLIVKPVNGSGSVGVTRSITTEVELQRAVRSVHDQNRDALVQEQFKGQEVRVTVINGEVASACLRDTPQLVGDGKGSLATLLTAENASREQITVPYLSYPQLTAELIDMPADSTYVPKMGQVWALGESAMISGGASVYNIDETLHESYKQLVLTMISSLKASFLVVDLLVADYTQPATPGSYVFLEFNTAPALKLYYSFRGGNQYDIVPRLADMIEAHS